MSGDRKLQVPEDINQLALKIYKVKARKDHEDLKKKHEENRIRINSVRKRSKAGFPYAKKIFEWTAQFRESDAGQRLLNVGDIYIEKGIFFFDTKLDGLNWCGLGMSFVSVWWHHSGCGAKPMTVKTPVELAEAVDSNILKAACDEIETGVVWETIRRRMKDTKYLKY